MTCSTGRSPRVAAMWICRVEAAGCCCLPVLLLATIRLTCRIVNTCSSPVGRSTVVAATRLVDIRQVGEQVGVDVLGQALAPGQHIETCRVHVGEQGRGPAAAVEPDQDPPVVADGPA